MCNLIYKSRNVNKINVPSVQKRKQLTCKNIKETFRKYLQVRRITYQYLILLPHIRTYVGIILETIDFAQFNLLQRSLRTGR